MSIEEIKTALADENVKGELLDFIMPDAQKHLESKGHIIRTPEQDEAFYKSKFEVDVKDVISNLHKKYDEDVFEILGKRKSPTQKTYEFIKEELKSLKDKATATGDQVDKDKLKELQDALNKANTDKETAMSEVHEKYFKKALESSLSSEFDKVSIALPPHLKTDEEKQAYVSNQKRMLKTDFLANYTAKEDQDGNIVFYKGDKLQSDTKDGSPLTASQLITANYAQYFAKDGRQVLGGGTGKGEKPAGGFTTREEVYTYLKDNGFEEGTKKFGDEAVKMIREHGIIK